MLADTASTADQANLIMARLDELATISAEPGAITRLHLTSEHRRANHLVATWMREAGMTARTDEAGNLIGRYESAQAGAPTLILGSHLDTVRNAGRYDGTLGVVLGIAVVAMLAGRNQRLPFAVEVISFADEEGVRFQAGLLGSKAFTGTLDLSSLELRDAAGVSLADALRSFGLDPDSLARAARNPDDVIGYLEVHIEQGPVLELEELSVGVVTAIAGALRHRVTVVGESGHAGTVPMNARRDALAAAAESVLALETICLQESAVEGTGVVGTVGELEVMSGAVNVIPGLVSYSVDLRAADAAALRRVNALFREALTTIGARRNVIFELEQLYEAPACVFEGPLVRALAEAVIAEGLPLRRLPSGAGHDAMALASFTDAAMLFVRCRGGVSHHPAESVAVTDVQRALAVAFRTVVSLATSGAAC